MAANLQVVQPSIISRMPQSQRNQLVWFLLITNFLKLFKIEFQRSLITLTSPIISPNWPRVDAGHNQFSSTKNPIFQDNFYSSEKFNLYKPESFERFSGQKPEINGKFYNITTLKEV